MYSLFPDGGVEIADKSQKLLTAKLPIFCSLWDRWSNYGALEKLDEMSGRIVDCNLQLTELKVFLTRRLYELLLEEFPDYRSSAKNIVQN